MRRTVAVRIDPAALQALHADMAAAGMPALTDDELADLAFNWGMREVREMYGFLANIKREAPDEGVEPPLAGCR